LFSIVLFFSLYIGRLNYTRLDLLRTMANPWLEHVKKFRTTHPDMKYKDVLVEARKTYTPVSKSASAKTPVRKKGTSSKGGALRLAGGSCGGALRLAGGSCGSGLGLAGGGIGSGIGLAGTGVVDKVYRSAMKKKGVRGIDGLFKGEKHAPLQMPDGKLTVGNFIGPGTHAETRIARGDKGLTMVDALARRHDALYSLAKTKKDVRRADEDFLKILKTGVIKDTKFNKMAGKLGIASKYAAETITGVKFPTAKELKANDATNQDLINVILETNRLFGIGAKTMEEANKILAKKHGKGLKLAGEGLKLAGEGLSLSNIKNVFTKYHKISKDLGVKPGDAIKVIKEKAKEKGLSLGSGIQSGEGCWDFISVLSFLPIPFVSDIARTISLVATPIRVATGTFTPALDGMITDTMKDVAAIFPKGIQDTIFKPATALAESVGMGMTPTPMEKIEEMYKMVKKIDMSWGRIRNSGATPKMIKKIRDVRTKTKKTADYVMTQMGLPVPDIWKK